MNETKYAMISHKNDVISLVGTDGITTTTDPEVLDGIQVPVIDFRSMPAEKLPQFVAMAGPLQSHAFIAEGKIDLAVAAYIQYARNEGATTFFSGT